MRGSIPGPYTIPNVHADIFCVFTNRTPATAMRGFGVTALDFALECQMDKLAFAVGMDPLEFRILNAYRDGDMKAHRREAKNCALIECAQVAAEKANWPLRDEFRRMSSRLGGGADRAGGVADRTRAPALAPAAKHAPAVPQRVAYERPTPAAPAPAAPAPPPRSAPPAPASSPAASSHGAARFLGVWNKEALIMAKRRGRGVAHYQLSDRHRSRRRPEPSAGLFQPKRKVHCRSVLIDLGQGMKSVTRQIWRRDARRAGRGCVRRHRGFGHRAALHGFVCLTRHAPRRQCGYDCGTEARGVMLEAAAEELEVDPGDLETDGKGSIRVKGAPHRSISVRDVAIAAQFRQGKTISGRGIFLVPLSDVDPGNRRDVARNLLRPRLSHCRS